MGGESPESLSYFRQQRRRSLYQELPSAAAAGEDMPAAAPARAPPRRCGPHEGGPRASPCLAALGGNCPQGAEDGGHCPLWPSVPTGPAAAPIAPPDLLATPPSGVALAHQLRRDGSCGRGASRRKEPNVEVPRRLVVAGSSCRILEATLRYSNAWYTSPTSWTSGEQHGCRQGTHAARRVSIRSSLFAWQMFREAGREAATRAHAAADAQADVRRSISPSNFERVGSGAGGRW